MRSFRKEDVVGKTVIETSGMVKGKVKDVVFDLNGTITLVVEGADGRDSQIPVSRITGISDHVIARSDIAVGVSTSSTGTSCKFCGASIAPDEAWCPNCKKSQS